MATRLRRGQIIILRGRDAPLAGPVYATCGGVLVAVGESSAASSCRTGCSDFGGWHEAESSSPRRLFVYGAATFRGLIRASAS